MRKRQESIYLYTAAICEAVKAPPASVDFRGGKEEARAKRACRPLRHRCTPDAQGAA